MALRIIVLLAIAVASTVASKALRTQDVEKEKSTRIPLDHDTELKRFEEQMLETKFDAKVGKFHHQMSQKLSEKALIRREGTTYDADGNPLITKKIVGSEYPTKFGAFYDTEDTFGCNGYYAHMEVIAFNICLTEYVYNHATRVVSANSSVQYTASGTGPYTVYVNEYTDTDCTNYDNSGSAMIYISGSASDCYLYPYGNDFLIGMGYLAFYDSFPDGPEGLAGNFEIGFMSSKCNSYPYSGYWQSIYESFGIVNYDTCTNNQVFTCENGVGTLNSYGTSDCSGDASNSVLYSYPKDCYDRQDDDKTTGDDYFTSDQAYLSSYCTAGGDGYTFTPLTSSSSSSSSSECFAGSETVTLESGASKLISEVVVGDRVLASTAQGAFVYSDVIAVPHAKNNDRVMFNEISLANGADIRMTGEHLLPVAASCGVDAVFTVTAAKNIAINSCVMTVDGQSAVVSNNKVAGTGIYTIVTNEEYVVVNGVVASPFAVSHAVGNTFYNVYRAIYKYVPGLLKSSFFQTFHATFASLAMKTW